MTTAQRRVSSLVSYSLRALAVAVGLLSPSACSAQRGLSPWGVAPSASLSRFPNVWLDDVAAAGVHAVRGFDQTLTPDALRDYRRLGIHLSGVLIWSDRVPRTFPVNSLPEFKRYVRDQVERYRGIVDHWEVWNEPPNFSADVSAASYAQVVVAAYESVKQVDPRIQVGIAAKSVHLNFLAKTIRAGARGKYDFVALHPYESAALVARGWDWAFAGIAGNVRRVLREEDPARESVPIWFTEMGIDLGSGTAAVSEDLQGDTLAKLFVLGIAQGIERMNWFSPRDTEGSRLGLFRADDTPRPALVALRTLIELLGQRPSYAGLVHLGSGTCGYLFAAGDELRLVTWSPSQRSHSLRVQEPLQVCEVRSGECQVLGHVNIGTSPLVLSASTRSRTGHLWRGGVQRTRVAARTHLARYRAQGPANELFLADASRAEDSTVGGELDLSGRSSARFAVDPSAVDASAHRLQVEAVVRGHGSARAGFKLRYESMSESALHDGTGMETAGAGPESRAQHPFI